MAKNYLPFIKRQRVEMPDGAGAFPRLVHAFTNITQLAMGGGRKTHLSDCFIYADYASQSAIAALDIRMGVTGRSYLTDRFYGYQFFHNGTNRETGCWQFPKPYRIFPGDRMRVKEKLPSDVNDTSNYTYPGVAFSGRRVLDNKPFLLYGTEKQFVDYADSGNVFTVNEDTLRCPADSPIDLYSVTSNIPFALYNGSAISGYINDADATYGFDPSGKLMIWGPDGRQWWDDEDWVNLLQLGGFVMDLNKPEWVVEPEETLVFEFRQNLANAQATPIDLYVTVRGCYEVEV